MSTYPAIRRPFRITPVQVVAILLVAALATWIVTVQRMRGMDAGPGTDLGTLGWYLGIWVTMMAAMMFPSAAPTVLMFGRARGDGQTWTFVAGDKQGPWVAGGALAVAGLYQLTPLKSACLRHCRSPLHFLLRGRPGSL